MHVYRPVCVAFAVVYLALRNTGLTREPAATLWAVTVQRALDIDLLSARDCAELISRFAQRLGRACANPWQAVDGGAVLAAALEALLMPSPVLAGAAQSAMLAHAPVTAGLAPLLRSQHAATYWSAVLAEAALAGGADPEHASQLIAAARGLRQCVGTIKDAVECGRSRAKCAAAILNPSHTTALCTTASSVAALEMASLGSRLRWGSSDRQAAEPPTPPSRAEAAAAASGDASATPGAALSGPMATCATWGSGEARWR